MNKFVVQPHKGSTPIRGNRPQRGELRNSARSTASFQEVLDRIKQSDINVTKHARARLDTRGVTLKPNQVEQVAKAMDQAAQKGVKEAVIVVGEQLLIASVANRTIITAAQKDDMQAKIITKIDGAIFI